MLVALSFPTLTSAQQDCQEVDCVGICGRFVDENNDGYCDHGFLSEVLKAREEKEEKSKKRAIVVGVCLGILAVAGGATLVVLRKRKDT